MTREHASPRGVVRSAELVQAAPDLDATLTYFTDLGFRVESVFPADAPRQVVVCGFGLRLRFDRDAPDNAQATLVLRTDATVASEATAPNGTHIRFEPFERELVLPPSTRPSPVLRRAGDEADWGTGRAGMQYRDLVPDRQGGRFIASHIRIPRGGRVPDYVHFHEVAFQVIFCRRGRVRVVYEDQGEPFWMEPGDCVLQPPRMRHRVLECTDGLEVVEVTCPAEHLTRADLELELPTPQLRPEREFSGQRFVRHVAAESNWEPQEDWESAGSRALGGFQRCNTGIDTATRGLADVYVLRPTASASGESPHAADRTGGSSAALPTTEHEFRLLFALDGRVHANTGSPGAFELEPGDSLLLPPQSPCTLRADSPELELLVVEASCRTERSVGNALHS